MTNDLVKRLAAFANCEANELEDTLNEAAARIEELEEALIDAVAHLAAAISLLERGGKAAKKAAPSDKMFDQMLKDYKASLSRVRALKTKELK